MGTRPCRGRSAGIPVRTGLLVSWPVPSDPSVANHPSPPDVPGLVLSRRLTGGLSAKGEPRPFGASASLGLRLSLAGSPRRQAESRSSKSYGRVVHLPLLPTPPHGDAVAFGYGVQTKPRRGLAPRGYVTLTSALGQASGRPSACLCGRSSNRRARSIQKQTGRRPARRRTDRSEARLTVHFPLAGGYNTAPRHPSSRQRRDHPPSQWSVQATKLGLG
jgi:hypothetical protein